jgi:hypothetical protein
MLGFAYLMLDCWLEVSCIRKVLRPANSIKVFRGFPSSQSKYTNVTSKHGDLALQVGGVSDKTVK